MSSARWGRKQAGRHLQPGTESVAYQRKPLLRKVGPVILVMAVVAVGLAVIWFVTNDSSSDSGADSDASENSETDGSPADGTPVDGCPEIDGSSPRTIDFTGRQPWCIDASQNHVAIFETSEGTIRVNLTATTTPMTVNNFVTLARWHYYDNTTIFRTDPSIDIIQGGSPHTESPLDPGPGYTIDDEPALDVDEFGQVTGPYRYQPGQLVMARSTNPNSASAQYFFTTGPNAALLNGQGSYVVFGETDEAGLNVLETIIGLHEPGELLGGAPSRTVIVRSVTIEVN